MKFVYVSSFVLLLLSISGCPSESDSPRDTTDSADSSSDVDSDSSNWDICDEGDLSMLCSNGPKTSFLLDDSYNFFFKSTLHLDSVEVRGTSPLTDLTFNWGELNTDFLKRSLSPLADIDLVLITIWDMSPNELAEKINNDTLNQQDNGGRVLSVYTNNIITSEKLTNFTMLGNPIVNPDDVAVRDSFFDATDPNYNPERRTHMVMAQTGTIAGKNARMLQFFTLSPTSDNTEVNLTSNSASLTYEIDLRKQSRLPVGAAQSNINIDWDGVTHNSLGNAFIPTEISRVVVAKYNMDVCEIENDFLNLESNYSEWYYKDLEFVTTEFNLADLTSKDGVPFSGITADGIWIIALFCGECRNPAPRFMTLLTPC